MKARITHCLGSSQEAIPHRSSKLEGSCPCKSPLGYNGPHCFTNIVHLFDFLKFAYLLHKAVLATISGSLTCPLPHRNSLFLTGLALYLPPSLPPSLLLPFPPPSSVPPSPTSATPLPFSYLPPSLPPLSLPRFITYLLELQ